MRLGFASAYFGVCLISIHFGHLAIHKNQPELPFGVTLDSIPTICRRFDSASQALEDRYADLEIYRTILDQQHTCSFDARASRDHCFVDARCLGGNISGVGGKTIP